jgi:hypothetical protein
MPANGRRDLIRRLKFKHMYASYFKFRAKFLDF